MATKRSAKLPKTEDEWKAKLSTEQYYVLRQKGTEVPFTGKLLHEERTGTFKCAACGAVLFDSRSKFDAHCGWPSFDAPMGKESVRVQRDVSHGMVRDEVVCARCGSHLGHVFDDGPTETGKRFCINSLSLDFEIGKDGKLVKKKK